jgi:DNA-binding MarR family transcriptional regulator
MTAGQLAKLSGLTSGAITGVVDRLERAGWARRERDPEDRRRVILQPGPQDTQTESGLYDPYMRAIDELFAKYEDRELALILDFVRRLVEINHQVARDEG